jgi:peroxiredoxin
MTLSVGDAAPDFSLPDQDRQTVSLAELRGTPVLLVFYPFAFSGICTGELCQLRDELTTYTDAGVTVLAISTDPAFSLKAFKAQEGYDFRLLSDFWPHGAVAQAYGVFNDVAGFANRGTFVVDRSGIIRFAEMKQPGEPRDQVVWTDALKALQDG